LPHKIKASTQIEQILEKHPNGIAEKYRGRLRSEIERCYRKWQRQQDNAATPHGWCDPDFSILDDRRGELPAFPIGVFRRHGGSGQLMQPTEPL